MKIKRQNKKIFKWYFNNCKDSLCYCNIVCLIVRKFLYMVCWFINYIFVYYVLNVGVYCSEMYLISIEGLDGYNDKIKLDGWL